MGFYSGLCKCCGKSILNQYAVKDYLTPEQDWLTQVVAISPMSASRKQVVAGIYDGYGRVFTAMSVTDLDLTPGAKWGVDLYHRACWNLAGHPLEYTGGSMDAPDQGFFIEPHDYLIAKPSAGKPSKGGPK